MAETVQIRFTAQELEKAIEVVQSLLSVSGNNVKIKTETVEVTVPTTAVIAAIESNYSTLLARVQGHDTTLSSLNSRIGSLESGKLDKTSLATINNQTLSNGGNITITSPLRYVEVK